MSKPFFGPQGYNINLDSLSFNTINTGFAYINSTGTVTTKLISSNEIENSINLQGSPTTSTASSGTNTTQIATTEFVNTSISNLVDSSPNTLNTLNELAAALNDDANFAGTVTNALSGKVGLTGNETISGIKTFSDSIISTTANIAGVTFVNGIVNGTATRANNISGGQTWSFPIQSVAGGTTFLPTGNQYSVLSCNAAGLAPSWKNVIDLNGLNVAYINGRNVPLLIQVAGIPAANITIDRIFQFSGTIAGATSGFIGGVTFQNRNITCGGINTSGSISGATSGFIGGVTFQNKNITCEGINTSGTIAGATSGNIGGVTFVNNSIYANNLFYGLSNQNSTFTIQEPYSQLYYLNPTASMTITFPSPVGLGGLYISFKRAVNNSQTINFISSIGILSYLSINTITTTNVSFVNGANTSYYTSFVSDGNYWVQIILV